MTHDGGIYLDIPPDAPCSGPIPLKVTMKADMDTYMANQGILDKALNLVLIRRDAPGVRLVATTDPHVHMLPDQPVMLTPGTDLTKAGTISGKREYDVLGFGAMHDGAADYYVVAAFARWVTEPVPLAITHKEYSLQMSEVSFASAFPLVFDKNTLVPPPSPGLLARLFRGKDILIQCALRIAIREPKFPQEPVPPPFVTLVAVRLSSTGGVFARSFLLDADSDGRYYVALFSIAFREIVKNPEKGRYRILVFSGDTMALPLELEFVPE